MGTDAALSMAGPQVEAVAVRQQVEMRQAVCRFS